MQPFIDFNCAQSYKIKRTMSLLNDQCAQILCKEIPKPSQSFICPVIHKVALLYSLCMFSSSFPTPHLSETKQSWRWHQNLQMTRTYDTSPGVSASTSQHPSFHPCNNSHIISICCGFKRLLVWIVSWPGLLFLQSAFSRQQCWKCWTILKICYRSW